MARSAIAMLALGCVAAAQPALPEDVLHLARVRAKVKTAFAALPDYVCLATTNRFASRRGSNRPVLEDIVRMDVLHTGKQEAYAWPEQDDFHESGPGQMVGHGILASGSFATHAIDVFLGSFTAIKYAGLGNVNGREARAWNYSIPEYASGWSIKVNALYATVGSEGSFWADASSDEVERLVVRATGIPPDFPLRSVTTTIDFAPMTIQNRVQWLAQSAEDVLVKADGTTSINRTSFSHCRQYSASTTISFDPGAGSKVPSGPAAAGARVQLEPGLRIDLVLETEIRSESAVVGDLILARLASDVRHGGKLIAPKGSPVRGRLRQMRRNSDPIDAIEVGLEFTEIDLPAGTALFCASLQSVNSPVVGLKWMLSKEQKPIEKPMAYGQQWEMQSRVVYLSQIPGVGNFFIEGKSFVLPKGMSMTWVTESAAVAK
jgi:hypothetical protein